jgi:hypothetical protein
MKTVEIRLIGCVSGSIWQPAIKCTKNFDFQFQFRNSDKNIRSHNEIDCLRDALLKIIDDGDFQCCDVDRIESATLIVTKQKGSNTITRERVLQGIGENADCFVNQ